MVESFEELHETVQAGIKTYLASEADKQIEFTPEDKGACSMTYKENGNRIKFLLAKFGDEYKVGFAFFEADERQPDWFDDVFTTEFDETFVVNLITEQLLESNPGF